MVTIWARPQFFTKKKNLLLDVNINTSLKIWKSSNLTIEFLARNEEFQLTKRILNFEAKTNCVHQKNLNIKIQWLIDKVCSFNKSIDCLCRFVYWNHTIKVCEIAKSLPKEKKDINGTPLYLIENQFRMVNMEGDDNNAWEMTLLFSIKFSAWYEWHTKENWPALLIPSCSWLIFWLERSWLVKFVSAK